jgi:2-keto-4-pentenoate hydratase/2-oxohepta-3-ene-1,7-dioic acid hydratase in catechol pathway
MDHRPFALGTFAPRDAGNAQPFAGMFRDERVYPLTRAFGPGASVRALVDTWDESLPRLHALAESSLGEDTIDIAELRVLVPVQPFGQIFQAAANYRRHVVDLVAAQERLHHDVAAAEEIANRVGAVLDERQRSGAPFVFLGSNHALTGAYDDVVLPFDHYQHDWEVELAAVVGRTARRVSRHDALSYIAGYVICNDITTRDALTRPGTEALGLDWLAAKNSPTFLPTGPYLVPAVFIDDPMDLRLTLHINGQAMQDESTADMLFDVAMLIEHISTVAELRPGDLVLTGSPAGNGASRGIFLAHGDIIDAEITGLGQQRNHCIAESVADSPQDQALSEARSEGHS